MGLNNCDLQPFDCHLFAAGCHLVNQPINIASYTTSSIFFRCLNIGGKTVTTLNEADLLNVS